MTQDVGVARLLGGVTHAHPSYGQPQRVAAAAVQARRAGAPKVITHPPRHFTPERTTMPDDRTPADMAVSDERIAVYRASGDGEPEAYVAIWERKSGEDDAFAEMIAEPDGWWRVTSVSGVRGMWVRPGTPEPWREIVHRLLGRPAREST